jgi:hypothetical protein
LFAAGFCCATLDCCLAVFDGPDELQLTQPIGTLACSWLQSTQSCSL